MSVAILAHTALAPEPPLVEVLCIMTKVAELPLVEVDNWQDEWLEILNLLLEPDNEKTDFERKRKGCAVNEETAAKAAKKDEPASTKAKDDTKGAKEDDKPSDGTFWENGSCTGQSRMPLTDSQLEAMIE